MNDFVHHTVAIASDDRKEHYKEVLDFRRLQRRMHNSRGNLGFACGIAGVVVAVCSGIALAAVMPLKTVVPYVVENNHETGYVGPAKPIDEAPKTWDEREVRREVYNYIMAREGYNPQTDRLNWTQVRDMSDADVGAPYNDWSNLRTSPRRRLGKAGFVSIENIWLSDPLKNEAGVTSYKFRFDRIETLNEATNERQICNGSLSLMFNYELMLPGKGDTYLNPLGTQVVSYIGGDTTGAPDCHSPMEKKQ